jgi:hypothetical protein
VKPFGDSIWVCDGDHVSSFGYAYPTRTVIIKLEGGDLFVWSPIQLTDRLKSAIDQIGPVKHLVAPNSLHHLFMKQWQEAYPAATSYAAPKLKARRKDLHFDFDLEDAPSTAWEEELDQVIVRGNLITTEVVFFHKKSRTVIFADLLQQFPSSSISGWRSLVARADLMISDAPTVPRKYRAAFINRRAGRITISKIMEWPLERIVMAHGPTVTQNARDVLNRSFHWLTK